MAAIRARGTGSFRNGYHRRSINGKQTFQHIIVAEKALGKPLPAGAVVHHVNGSPSDNRPENLVICPNQAYHALIHERQKALEICGYASWRKCRVCKKYDSPENLVYNGNARVFWHRECDNIERRARYHRQQNRIKAATTFNN